MKPRLSRRTVLRGAGLAPLAVALPPLEAMLTGNGELPAACGQTATPIYFLTFFVPNGVVPAAFWPAEAGAAYTITRSLKPLEPYRGDFLLLQNLAKREYYDNQNINSDAHARGHATFATGMPIEKAGAGGISVDQIAAPVLSKGTKFPSLPVALGGARDGSAGSHISWAARERPVLAERDPGVLFARVFGSASTDPVVIKNRRSLIDFLKDDVGRLKQRLSAGDQGRLDEHLTSIRELETQLSFMGPACEPGAPPPPLSPATPIDSGNGAYTNDRVKLLIDLQVMAFKCDLTRVGSFMLGSRNNKRQFPWLGIKDPLDGHHGISHDTSPEGLEKQTKIVVDEMEQFAYLLGKLKGITIGGTTMLDRSLVFWANEHGDGLGHNGNNVPVIIAGRAGGKINPGRHVRYPKDTPYSNVFVSMLNALGLPNTSFGNYGKAPLNLAL